MLVWLKDLQNNWLSWLAVALTMVVSSAACALAVVFVPGLTRFDDYSWFVGCGIGFAAYAVLAPRAGVSVEAQLTDKEVRV